MKKIEYALYKGDVFLMIGTIKEIADNLNIKEKSVMFFNSPTYQKRNKGNNHKILVRL